MYSQTQERKSSNAKSLLCKDVVTVKTIMIALGQREPHCSVTYCERSDDQSRTCSQVLVGVGVLRQGHSSHAVVQVHVPVIAQLPLPVEGVG